jgi:general secretion pathway protein K
VGFSRDDECARAMRRKFDLRSQLSNRSGERGLALLIVLWIFIFLFVVAFDFSSSVREEGMAAQRYTDESEGYYLALAGFEESLYRLLSQPAGSGQRRIVGSRPLESQELVDGAWREKDFGAGSYRVRLIDESGKININRADEGTLRRVLSHLGLDESQRSIVVDSILDWRDPDNLHRANGAEDEYYLGLSPSYTTKDAAFDTVEELLWVRGVTSELFYGSQDNGNRTVGLREILTVDSPIDRINLRTASAEVIQALVGLSPEKSRDFVEKRRQLSESTLVDLLKLLEVGSGDAAVRQFVFTNPSVITIEAVGRHAHSLTQRKVKGVVRLARGNAGIEIIRWVDRDTIGTFQ